MIPIYGQVIDYYGASFIKALIPELDLKLHLGARRLNPLTPTLKISNLF